MPLPTNKIPLSDYNGSDIERVIRFHDVDDVAIDLTGYGVVSFDIPTALTGRVSQSITDATAGEVTLTIEGTDPIGVGIYPFRLQTTDAAGGTTGGLSIGYPLIELEII